ncbi:MAG: transcriptional repressor LexA [bacterium]
MSNSEGLTRRQGQILNFIQNWISAHGYPPSVREIGAAVGLSSSSTVHKHLQALETKGFLRRRRNQPRALEVLTTPSPATDSQNAVIKVPIIGRVAAGVPLLAVENQDGSFPLPAEFSSKGPLFLLRIRGHSMIDAGILDGDYVLVRQQPQVENGEIAVVLIENEATVKYFYRTNRHIRLQPANPHYETVVVSSAQVLGKVTGVLRFWP